MNALQVMSNSLNVTEKELKETLLATVCSNIKTEAEFKSFIIVSNKYNLNPITKEIYAFPGKSGGIIPIVSTDGWTRIMKTHPDYKTHNFIFSEKIINLPKSHPCPEWCEIIIEKKDGSKIAIREYAREVFRDLNYQNPWQTHPTRMLRHKTKIQGAREAFGFSGIYDADEGERIIEMKEAREVKGMPPMPQAINTGDKEIAPEKPAKTNNNFISGAQGKRLYAIAMKTKSNDELHEYLASKGISSTKEIPKTKYDEIVAWAENSGIQE